MFGCGFFSDSGGKVIFCSDLTKVVPQKPVINGLKWDPYK